MADFWWSKPLAGCLRAILPTLVGYASVFSSLLSIPRVIIGINGVCCSGIGRVRFFYLVEKHSLICVKNLSFNVLFCLTLFLSTFNHKAIIKSKFFWMNFQFSLLLTDFVHAEILKVLILFFLINCSQTKFAAIMLVLLVFFQCVFSLERFFVWRFWL